MDKKTKTILKLRFIAIILGVASLGVALFVLGFSYLYKEPLSLGACDLCTQLNPFLNSCFN